MFLASFGVHVTHVRRSILNTPLVLLTWLFLAALLLMSLVLRSNIFHNRSHISESTYLSVQKWGDSVPLQPSTVISVTVQPTQTHTSVATFTPLQTPTAIHMNIPVPIANLGVTPTLTITAVPSLVSTPITITLTPISTSIPIATVTSLPTSTLPTISAATPTVTASLAVTQMPTSTNTFVPTATPTLISTAVVSAPVFSTPVFSTPTVAPTLSLTGTETRTTTYTVSPAPTSTQIFTLTTPTVTPIATITPTLIVTYTPTPTYTATPSPMSTIIPTPTAAQTPRSVATVSPSPISTVTPTQAWTPTPIPPTPDPESCMDADFLPSDGTIHSQKFVELDDLHWMYFDLKAGVDYLIEASALAGENIADLGIELYHECGGRPQVIGQDFSFTRDIHLTYSYTRTGPVYLKINDISEGISGKERPYNISVYAMDSLPEPGAVVILASRLEDGDPQQANIDNVANEFHDIVTKRGYLPNQIKFLTSKAQPRSKSSDTRVPPSKDELRDAITEWAVAHVRDNRPFTLYIISHGDKDRNRLYIDKQIDKQNEEWITPNELDGWLKELEDKVPSAQINVIIESSNAGSFITGEESISKSGRMIITSAGEDNQAYSSKKGAIFSDFFLDALDDGSTVFHSYTTGRWAARQTRPWQSPSVDANGNGIINEQDDYILASRRGLLYGRFSGILSLSDEIDELADDKIDELNWGEPFIVNINNTRIRDDRCIIEAIVRDDKKVHKVWAIIYGPNSDQSDNDGSLGTDLAVNVSLDRDPDLALDTAEQKTPESELIIPLDEQGNDRYRAEHDCVQKGDYRIVVNADDEEGRLADPVGNNLVNPIMIFLPIIRK